MKLISNNEINNNEMHWLISAFSGLKRQANAWVVCIVLQTISKALQQFRLVTTPNKRTSFS